MKWDKLADGRYATPDRRWHIANLDKHKQSWTIYRNGSALVGHHKTLVAAKVEVAILATAALYGAAYAQDEAMAGIGK